MKLSPPWNQSTERAWEKLKRSIEALEALTLEEHSPLEASTFQEFVTSLGIKLTPAQEVLTSVAFDDVPATESDLCERIFGTRNPEKRRVVAAVCGARAGKSFLLCAIRLLHLAFTVPLTTLARGEQATALIVAPDLRLARQCLRYAVGAATTDPRIKDRVVSATADSLVLARSTGQRVALECLPATRGGSALRGRSLVGAALDESAFFYDESYQVNDVELFKAVVPRVLPQGQVVIASTPWAETGLLYELYREHWGKPGAPVLVAHAPTLLLREDEHTAAVVDEERKRDPVNAAREFDAQFLFYKTGAFFDGAAIRQCTAADLFLPRTAEPSDHVTAGADFGFRSDSSALVIVHRHKDPRAVLGDVYSVAEILELQPEPGALLTPSQVVSEFAQVAKRHGVDGIMADSHYKESIREHLLAAQIRSLDAPEGNQGKLDSYLKMRVLLLEGRLRLPNHPRLLRQLREIVSRPTPGGSLQILSPRRGASGGHGDIVSALVLAVYPRFGIEQKPALPEPGTRERELYDLMEEQKRMRKQAEKQFTKVKKRHWEF